MNMQSSTVASDLKAAIYKQLEPLNETVCSKLSEIKVSNYLEYQENTIEFMVGIVKPSTINDAATIDKLAEIFASRFSMIMIVILQ